MIQEDKIWIILKYNLEQKKISQESLAKTLNNQHSPDFQEYFNILLSETVDVVQYFKKSLLLKDILELPKYPSCEGCKSFEETVNLNENKNKYIVNCNQGCKNFKNIEECNLRIDFINKK